MPWQESCCPLDKLEEQTPALEPSNLGIVETILQLNRDPHLFPKVGRKAWRGLDAARLRCYCRVKEKATDLFWLWNWKGCQDLSLLHYLGDAESCQQVRSAIFGWEIRKGGESSVTQLQHSDHLGWAAGRFHNLSFSQEMGITCSCLAEAHGSGRAQVWMTTNFGLASKVPVYCVNLSCRPSIFFFHN